MTTTLDNIERSMVCPTATLAVDFIAQETGLPKSRVKRAMTLGAVWIKKGARTQRLRRAKTPLKPNDEVSIYYSEQILAETPPTPTLIADHRIFSVWHKPAGLMSSGSRYGDHCSIYRLVEKQLDRPVFLVHRLDMFASGVIVLAHGKQSAASLAAQFKNRTVKKIYKTIVQGVVEAPCRIDQLLDGKAATTLVQPLENDGTHTLLEVEILTGRKHQIRRHLAGIGAPIVGDRQYGARQYPAMILTAVSLAFDNPAPGSGEVERLTFDLPVSDHPRLDDPGLVRG